MKKPNDLDERRQALACIRTDATQRGRLRGLCHGFVDVADGWDSFTTPQACARYLAAVDWWAADSCEGGWFPPPFPGCEEEHRSAYEKHGTYQYDSLEVRNCSSAGHSPEQERSFRQAYALAVRAAVRVRLGARKSKAFARAVYDLREQVAAAIWPAPAGVSAEAVVDEHITHFLELLNYA